MSFSYNMLVYRSNPTDMKSIAPNNGVPSSTQQTNVDSAQYQDGTSPAHKAHKYQYEDLYRYYYDDGLDEESDVFKRDVSAKATTKLEPTVVADITSPDKADDAATVTPDSIDDYGQYITDPPNAHAWARVYYDYTDQRMANNELWHEINATYKNARLVLDKTDAAYMLCDEHVRRNAPIPELTFHDLLRAGTRCSIHLYSAIRPYTRDHVVKDSLPTSAQDVETNVALETTLMNVLELVLKTVPRQPVWNRRVPFSYDWFTMTGRVTSFLIDAHIALVTCTLARALAGLEYGSVERDLVYVRLQAVAYDLYTDRVQHALVNICPTFKHSLGWVREESNGVVIAVARAYSLLLHGLTDNIRTNGTTKPWRKYDEWFRSVAEELFIRDYVQDRDSSVGRYSVPTQDIVAVIVAAASEKAPKTKQRREARPQPQQQIKLDGIYMDRTFFAHRALRMYSYIQPYVQYAIHLDTLFPPDYRSNTDVVKSSLLAALEPVSRAGEDDTADTEHYYYFNIHSRSGGFKFATGVNAFRTFNMYKALQINERSHNYYRMYNVDFAKVLFVVSKVMTFHSIGHTMYAYAGEIDQFVNWLLPAWIMGQRPIYVGDPMKSVPGSPYDEPGVVNVLCHTPGFTLKGHNTRDLMADYACSSVLRGGAECGCVITRFVEKHAVNVLFERTTLIVRNHIYSVYTVIRDADPDHDAGRVALKELTTDKITFSDYLRIVANAGGKSDTSPATPKYRVSAYSGEVDGSAMISELSTPNTSASVITNDDEVFGEGLKCMFKYCTVTTDVISIRPRAPPQLKVTRSKSPYMVVYAHMFTDLVRDGLFSTTYRPSVSGQFNEPVYTNKIQFGETYVSIAFYGIDTPNPVYTVYHDDGVACIYEHNTCVLTVNDFDDIGCSIIVMDVTDNTESWKKRISIITGKKEVRAVRYLRKYDTSFVFHVSTAP